MLVSRPLAIHLNDPVWRDYTGWHSQILPNGLRKLLKLAPSRPIRIDCSQILIAISGAPLQGNDQNDALKSQI